MHCTLANAQRNSNLICGFQLSANRSQITDLETMIIPETFFTGYDKGIQWKNSLGGGLFLNYRDMEEDALPSWLGAQFETGFSRQNGMMNFDNHQTGYHYNIQFRYDYIYLTFLPKWYLFADGSYKNFAQAINVGVGAVVNFKTNSEDLYFKSTEKGSEPGFGSDLEQQRELRDVLKGKTNAGILFNLGIELPNFPVSVDFRYVTGITDVINTEANPYNFINNNNKNNLYQVMFKMDLVQLLSSSK
jgi:hypothetical protein